MVLILSFSEIADLSRLATELEFVHEEFPPDTTRNSIRLAYSRVATLTGLSNLINNLHKYVRYTVNKLFCFLLKIFVEDSVYVLTDENDT